MRHQPMAIAFVIAMIGAAAVGIRPGSSAADWGPLLLGAALAGAMTGIVATIMQFLPQRLFLPSAVVAGMIVAFGVSALLYAAGAIWLAPVPTATVYVWAGAAIAALLVSRASGLRLPPVRPSSP
jgi:hypothetical protein